MTSSPARARVRGRDVDMLVVEIAKLIASRQWVPGQTVHEIAAREGVKPHRVEEWAVEAGRMLRVGHDVEMYRQLNLRRLDRQYRRAEDTKAAVAAVAEQNKMLGLHAPTVHKVDVSVQAYAKLDDAQMLEHVEAQLTRLTELRTRLLAKKATAALPAVIDVEVEDESIEG
jgi:hypothetical protein